MAEQGRLGIFSALLLSVGAMIGGGVFVVIGIAAALAKGAVPWALLLGGIVALLTAYSYLRLTLYYINEGGTVYFLNQGFGKNLFTSWMNTLLLINYVVMLSLYAHAFGAYAARLFASGGSEFIFWKHVFMTGIIIVLFILNILSKTLIVKMGNIASFLTIVLLGIFIIWGVSDSLQWANLNPKNYAPLIDVVSTSMVLFVNYEGFELLANAASEIKEPKVTLPVGYLGGVVLVLLIYSLVGLVCIGYMSELGLVRHADYAVAEVAEKFMGVPGRFMIIIAALVATTAAIAATFFSSGRLTRILAIAHQLPRFFAKKVLRQPVAGPIWLGVLGLLISNFINLHAIAAAGSMGFLIIYALVNLANIVLRKKTGGFWWISCVSFLACVAAIFMVFWHDYSHPQYHYELWVFLGVLVFALCVQLFLRLLHKLASTERR